MGNQLNIVTSLHKRTKRDYLGRMMDRKVDCMKVSREYGRDYWDGDRRYGYGGYKYDGRWSIVAEKLIDQYDLRDNARILDVGCGKGFLLYELSKLLPNAFMTGFDASEYALENAKEEIRDRLFPHRAQDPFPFGADSFDLVISITTLHNLGLSQLDSSIREIERVGKNKYIAVESFRNELELFNLQCWALTCEAFLRPEDWEWLFDCLGYSGDYEFIFFE